MLAVGRQFTVQNPNELYVLVTSALPTTRRDMTRTVLILFVYLGFYVAFNTVQVISRWVVGRAEETNWLQGPVSEASAVTKVVLNGR